MNTRLLVNIAIVAAALTQAIGASAENRRTDSAEPIVLINPFEIPPEKLAATISMWEKARDFLSTQPGYLSTKLHQSIGPDARFRLVNVAKWDSVDAFTAAIKKMRTDAGLPRVDGVKAWPDVYTVVRE